MEMQSVSTGSPLTAPVVTGKTGEEAKAPTSVFEILSRADRFRATEEKHKVSVIGWMMLLAKSRPQRDQFEAECAAAESRRRDAIKERAKREGLDDAGTRELLKLPGTYRTAKSTILAVWETGHHPSEFGTWYELRKFYNEYQEQQKSAKPTAEPTKAFGHEMKDSELVSLYRSNFERMIKLSEASQREILEGLSQVIRKYEEAQAEEVQEREAKHAKEVQAAGVEVTDEDIEELEAAQIVAATGSTADPSGDDDGYNVNE